MKLSTETYVMGKRFGDKKAIKMIKDAGFDCYDYSMYWTDEKGDMLGDDYKEKAIELRKFADETGISCNQAHAPFEIGYDDEFDTSNKHFLRLVRSLEVAAVLGAKNVIVHAVNVSPEQDFYEHNRKFYKSLIPFCKQYGIKISVENLFTYKDDKLTGILSNPTDHKEFVKSLDSDCFNICVDVGHSAITGNKPEDVISEMNNQVLQSLHIHDNDCVSDLHKMPYFGDFNWNNIMNSLKKINYNGELTFEIFGTLDKLDDELLAPALSFAEKIGRNLIKK